MISQKAGELREILLNATTKRNANGEIIGVVGVGQDITLHQKAKKEAEVMAMELTQLIDTANAPIFGVDTELRVNEWNVKMSEISGFSKEEALGKPLLKKFIRSEHRNAVGKVSWM